MSADVFISWVKMKNLQEKVAANWKQEDPLGPLLSTSLHLNSICCSFPRMATVLWKTFKICPGVFFSDTSLFKGIV
jgi:hypothetical protein